jgi:hypothetical protein
MAIKKAAKKSGLSDKQKEQLKNKVSKLTADVKAMEGKLSKKKDEVKDLTSKISAKNTELKAAQKAAGK